MKSSYIRIKKGEEKMNSYRNTAIIVGVLFIIATTAPILGYYIFLGTILDTPDYLINVSANENRLITGALFELIMTIAIAGTAILMYPILKKYNES